LTVKSVSTFSYFQSICEWTENNGQLRLLYFTFPDMIISPTFSQPYPFLRCFPNQLSIPRLFSAKWSPEHTQDSTTDDNRNKLHIIKTNDVQHAVGRLKVSHYRLLNKLLKSTDKTLFLSVPCVRLTILQCLNELLN